MNKKTSIRSKKVSSEKKLGIQNTKLDLITAALIISLLINLFVVCLWISLQITSQYDSELIRFFIHR